MVCLTITFFVFFGQFVVIFFRGLSGYLDLNTLASQGLRIPLRASSPGRGG